MKWMLVLLALTPGVSWPYTETSRIDTFGYRHSTTRDDNGKVISYISTNDGPTNQKV